MRLLLLVFAVLIGSFLVATLVAQRMSSHAATLSEALVEHAMPRIEHVVSLRDATLEAQLALADLVHGSSNERARARPVLDARLAWLQQEARASLDASRLHPVHPDSRLSLEVGKALERFEAAVVRTRALVDRDPGAARALFRSDLLPAAGRLGERAMREIGVNAQRGRELALELEQVRGRIIWLSYASIAICVVVAATGLVLLRRQAARQLARINAYARDQQSKADEMEQFAGRVAHDLRSPLATAALAAEMLARQLDAPEPRSVLGRLQRSLTRAAAIIDGLLEFARAGAVQDPGARANLRDVIQDIADGLGAELERAAIKLDVEAIPSVRVPCSTGVLVSLVGNLVRNAIKYMGTRDPRRISIRALDRGGAIRIEISDTGPGIAEGIVPRLFEPYFRGVTDNQAGLGLGLPTVRKLAEGHGGCVGVRSVLGQGSTFWFELPHAGAAWEPDEGDELPRRPPTEAHLEEPGSRPGR